MEKNIIWKQTRNGIMMNKNLNEYFIVGNPSYSAIIVPVGGKDKYVKELASYEK